MHFYWMRLGHNVSTHLWTELMMTWGEDEKIQLRNEWLLLYFHLFGSTSNYSQASLGLTQQVFPPPLMCELSWVCSQPGWELSGQRCWIPRSKSAFIIKHSLAPKPKSQWTPVSTSLLRTLVPVFPVIPHFQVWGPLPKHLQDPRRNGGAKPDAKEQLFVTMVFSYTLKEKKKKKVLKLPNPEIISEHKT